jgi:PRTRC genetic system protein C
MIDLSTKKQKIMLVTTTLERVFLFQDKGQQVRLADPEPKFSPQAVQNFYANTYPILNAATIDGPTIHDDTVQYEFKTTIGTKG